GGTVDVELEIVGAEEEDHQVERLVGIEQRRQQAAAIAVTRSGIVVEDGGAAAQPLGDDARGAAQPLFEHGGPAVRIGVARLRLRIGTEGQAVAEGEDGLHGSAFQASIITGVSMRFLKAASSSAPRAPSTDRWSQETVTVMKEPVLI